MKSYLFLTELLIFEVFVLFGLTILLVFHRIFLFIKSKNEIRRKKILSKYLLHCLENDEVFDLDKYPGKKYWFFSLLEALEAFDHKLQENKWFALRNRICEELLFPKARKWVKSFFWVKRNFAARVFALHPLWEDEKKILKLMGDPKFLVRGPASLAGIRLKSGEAVEKILWAINNEPGYAKFYHRDLLIHGSRQVFDLIVHLAENPINHKAALDVLGGYTWGGPIPFLERDLQSKEGDIRDLAYQVLQRNLFPGCLVHFRKGAADSDMRVRKTSMKGLGILNEEETLNILEKGLSDPDWEVRIEAGKSLMQKGEKGVEILKRQKQNIAIEAAQYAMDFG